VGGIVLLTAAAPHRTVTNVNASNVALPLAVVGFLALCPILFRRAGGLEVVFGAGFAFALTAFCIKLIADALDDGRPLAVVVMLAIAGLGGLIGMLNEQTALQRRPATQVAPIIFVVELLVPIALAVIVVGEDWDQDVAGILPALALVVAGVVALTRTRAVATLMASESEQGPAESDRALQPTEVVP
jgi:drug/metabolite transporter (DMT)-like permease